MLIRNDCRNWRERRIDNERGGDHIRRALMEPGQRKARGNAEYQRDRFTHWR